MPRFDAILFDFDGVLVDSEPLHRACWAEVLAPFGVSLEWDVYCRRYIGMDDREMIRILAAERDPPCEWELLFAQYPRKQELFREQMRNPPFVPGLAAFLQSLRKDYKLAVVSSSARIEIEPPLIAGGIREYFETLVAGRDAPRHKPAPDPYLLAAERLGVRSPLVLEDSPAGIASGRAAGFEVLPVERAADMPRQLLRYLSGGATAA